MICVLQEEWCDGSGICVPTPEISIKYNHQHLFYDQMNMILSNWKTLQNASVVSSSDCPVTASSNSLHSLEGKRLCIAHYDIFDGQYEWQYFNVESNIATRSIYYNKNKNKYIYESLKKKKIGRA
eukprot:141893_1